MSKRTVFTTITPLPSGVTRQIVLDFLHDHEEMMDLNPLVKERHPIPAPLHALADEQDCQWFSLTDKISYLAGVAGDVSYTCAFHDLPTGLQTHCYAPAGLTIRDKWTVGGSLPGERPEPVELGLKVPLSGLYLREDVDMRCNVVMTSFVKKTLKRSHAALVERLKFKVQEASGNGSPPEPFKLTATKTTVSETSSTSGYQDTYPSASAPPSRPGSAASSTSSYSAHSSQLWSPAASSLLTSPASSAQSSPRSRSDSSENPRQQRSGTYDPLLEKPSFVPPHLRTLPGPGPGSAFVQAAAPAPEPATPFLRRPQQPDWPPPAQGPHSQPYTRAYIPPSPQPGGAWGRAGQDGYYYPGSWERPGSAMATAADYDPPAAAAASTTARGVLTDDALWQALGGGGGGRLVVAQNGAGCRAKNDGARPSQNQSPYQGHPDYPQMSPYDGDDGGVGMRWGGVGGMRTQHLMMVPLAATLDGPFRARLD